MTSTPGWDGRMASADPLGRTIRRFTWTERAAHWWLAAHRRRDDGRPARSLYFPPFAQLLDRPTAKHLHLWSAIALPVGWLVLTIVGDRRALGRTLRDADRFDDDDVAWLKGGPRRILDRRGEPPQGRLNAGQKLNLALTLGLLGRARDLGDAAVARRARHGLPVRRQRPRPRPRDAGADVPGVRAPLPGAAAPRHAGRAVRRHDRVRRPRLGARAPREVGRGRGGGGRQEADGGEPPSGAAEQALEPALPAPLGEEFPER